MKKTLPILLAALLWGACKGGVHEEVITSFEDGSPELVYLLKGKENKYVGEKRFYSNGKKHSEIHYLVDGITPSGTWRFFYPTGESFATWEAESDQWSFSAGKCGYDFLEDRYDSLRAVRLSEKRMPLEVCGFRGDTTLLFQFYEDFRLQCDGQLVGGAKEGRWTYHYPSGTVQLEALFVGGVENGAYRCYRENGVPYYLGYYINGQRAGLWEFYDEQGNLSGRKNFDE